MIPTHPAKTIVTRTPGGNDWFGGEYKMNLYRGCNHGCVYCDSRSDCYGVEEFDIVKIKENALEILRDELSRKRKTGVVITGAMSDPYNPHEKELEATRNSLALLDRFRFGAGVATKSDLVTRDIDLLRDIKKHSPVIVKITVTTTDDNLAKKLEPNAPSPSRRLAALEKLSNAGIFAGILLMPVMPFLEDSEENIVRIVRQARLCGAKFISAFFGVTQRAGQREYMLRCLEKHYPGLSQKYSNAFGENYVCAAKNSNRLFKLFRSECEKAGLLFEMADIVKGYKSVYSDEQTSLF